MAAFCGQCGTPLRGDALYCPMCGASTRDDDTADREMPEWFANGEPPPGHAPATVTVARARSAMAAPAAGVAEPAAARPNSNLYIWVSGAVVATAAVVVTVVLLLWPTAPQTTQTSGGGSTTTTTTTPPPTTAAPTTIYSSAPVQADTSPATSSDWRSWININTDPGTIKMYPCRQMASHGVPYSFVVEYFKKWNWRYLAEGGGGMDQDGNGKPCEGQFPQAASYHP